MFPWCAVIVMGSVKTPSAFVKLVSFPHPSFEDVVFLPTVCVFIVSYTEELDLYGS